MADFEKIPKGRGFLYKCGQYLYGTYKKHNGTLYMKCYNQDCPGCPGTAKIEAGQQQLLTSMVSNYSAKSRVPVVAVRNL